jgi:peptide/nickel transport system ATP-binding protein
MRDQKPLVSIQRLCKRFPIEHDHVVYACDDVTLDIWRGETLGLIGESGSGKTTLGRCLLRLIEPTSGNILFEGTSLSGLSQREIRSLRSDMQIVFQEPFDSLNPQIRIGRQITEPLRIHRRIGRGEAKKAAERLLRMVGLPPTVADVLPSSLSAGAQQRCSIARAISTEPKLIVLDEPTSALPPESEIEIISLLKSLQQRLEVTYLFISHDLSLVRSICDRVAVMYLSQVVEVGDHEAIFEKPQHPYTRALLAAHLLPDPRYRAQPGERRNVLKGEIPSPIDLPLGCYLASRCPHVKPPRCVEEHQHLLPEDAPPDAQLVRCWRVSEGELRFVPAD